MTCKQYQVAVFHFNFQLHINFFPNKPLFLRVFRTSLLKTLWEKEQEGHDGPVFLHWLICKILSYQTLQYLGIGLKHKTPMTKTGSYSSNV